MVNPLEDLKDFINNQISDDAEVDKQVSFGKWP
jgi:hypothetical protein